MLAYLMPLARVWPGQYQANLSSFHREIWIVHIGWREDGRCYEAEGGAGVLLGLVPFVLHCAVKGKPSLFMVVYTVPGSIAVAEGEVCLCCF